MAGKGKHSLDSDEEGEEEREKPSNYVLTEEDLHEELDTGVCNKPC